ncbi:MAG: RagB/SusD family nutrient uptake outer membrane protein, partial [Hymenobacter sp.]
MKKIVSWSTAALGLGMSLGLGSCKDALNIEPQQSIDASASYNTSQKVAAAVVGAYARLDDPSLYGTDLVLVPELLGSFSPRGTYLVWNGTFQNYGQMVSHSQTSTLTNAQAIWTAAYAAINQCNLVLDNLAVVTDAGQRAQYEGEARFIRGLMYFELVRLYAQQYQAGGPNAQAGVPLSLTPITTAEQADTKLSRATVAQVYTQVVSDLQAAIQKLPAQNVARASKYSAEAILARVYLQQGNYTAAATQANDVITNSGTALTGSVAAVFSNRNSGESLFEIQQNDQNNAGTSNAGLATFFAGYSPTGAQDVLYGRADVSISASFVGLYEPSDTRGSDDSTAIKTKTLIYVGDGNRLPGRYRTLKWRTYGQNIPVVRLAEMYLIRAEAEVRAGQVAAATADVNVIRARSGASAITAVTINDVLLERQLELAFEGFRVYDLVRTGRVVGTLPATSPKLILPIPQREINNNS